MKYKTFIKWLLYINLGFIALMVGITIFVKIPAAVAILGVLAIGALVYRWLFKKKEEEYSKSISEKTSGMLNDEDSLLLVEEMWLHLLDLKKESEKHV